jgi:hypothetical protein
MGAGMSGQSEPFPVPLDEKSRPAYLHWLASVKRVADRHGLTERQLVGVLFEYAPDDGWRKLFEYHEAHRYAFLLMHEPEKQE